MADATTVFSSFLVRILMGNRLQMGAGSPENAISAPVGSLYLRSDGGSATSAYIKESGGTGNTGWVGK